MALIDDVKKACRVKTDVYDSQFTNLIESAKIDLGIAGVTVPTEIDAIVNTAICTYCMMRFGIPEDYDRLKASYDEQKAQLSNASGYTNWSVNNNV